jgi:DNA segregation ATPase FtsK/SpoIIIE-like protein
MRRDDRLRHHLEIQSLQIEEVFTRHQVEARVAGGHVQARDISFNLQAQLQSGWERLQLLKRDLAQALGVADLRLEQSEDGWQLTVRRDNNHPVDLLEMLEGGPALPRLTAALGIADDGRPILINLAEQGIGHTLVIGQAGAGKSSLLRSAAISLALNNRQAHLQLLIIDPDQEVTNQAHRSLLAPLAYLPHMLAPVVERLEEIAVSLNYLVDEINYREEQRSKTPAILLLIDNLHCLLEVGGQPFLAPLTRIIQRGDRVGVHLLLSYREGSGAALPSLLRSHFSARLVGQVENAQQARAATGLADSQADYLLGQGDFLAVSRGEMIHFQAAYINDYDLHHTLDRLYRQPQKRVVAQPTGIRPTLETPPSGYAPRQFQRDDRDRFQLNDLNANNQ